MTKHIYSKFNSLLLWVLLVTIIGCEAPYGIEDSYTKSKIVFESQLDPNSSEIQAIITTSLDVNHASEFLYPENANCILTLESGEKLKMEFSHKDDGFKYRVDYKPSEGERIQMRTHISGNGIGDIVSESTIPYQVKNMETEIYISKFPLNDDFYRAEIHSLLDLSGNKQLNYVRLEARLFYFPFYMENGDTIVNTNVNGTKRYVDFDLSQSDHNVSVFTHKSGSYIDLKKSDIISLVMTSSEDIPNDHILTHIEYLITSINEESFRYDRSIHLSVLSLESPYTEPVVGYSNIGNGLGVFGAQSKLFKTIVSLR